MNTKLHKPKQAIKKRSLSGNEAAGPVHDRLSARHSHPSGTDKGIRLPRFHTQPGAHPFDQIEWTRRSTAITNPDGSVVFKMDDV